MARPPWCSSSAPKVPASATASGAKPLPARHVTVRDATGAGDCFCGNLLARLAKGDDVFRAAAYANAAAALSVQGFGAVNPMPRSSSVFAVL